MRNITALITLCLCSSILFSCGAKNDAPKTDTPEVETPKVDHPFLLGRGIADVTGPARGVQMWGYVREDQITEGIHTRLFSRAFIIAEKDTPEDRVLFVSVDIGSTTHAMQLEVVDRLKPKYGDTYTLDNVILSATHTHSGPGSYWHWGSTTPLGSGFVEAHFNTIVGGVVDSIVQAHETLAPGSILMGTGIVEGGGANRSLVAYEANPEEERAKYNSDTDKNMTLLKLVDDSGPIGMINWFASHPTAMTYDNHLISGDHKGHASQRFEESMGAGFVAAFAQTNCGDVSPNLNLDNTGPGENEFETTRIIAERQLETAEAIFASASDIVGGEIESKQIYVNFAYLPVDEAYTNGAGQQRTCPSAMGYAMAAGSTEDGGGHPMFKEGMVHRNGMIDGLVKNMYKLDDPSDECRECHGVKPIFFATGEQDPPAQTQVLPVTLTRIGTLTLASVAAEVTTMAGRRLRNSIAEALGTSPEQVIIVGYANDYGGYLTTKEEYDMQQYEGGHTIFGPWSLAAYQQEFDRLAKGMVAGETVASEGDPKDLRAVVVSVDLVGDESTAPEGKALGAVATAPQETVAAGDTVEASFYALDPRTNFPQPEPFVAVQKKNGDAWETIADDHSWSTKLRWRAEEETPETLLLTVSWAIPADTASGEYRIAYIDGEYGGQTGAVTVQAVTLP